MGKRVEKATFPTTRTIPLNLFDFMVLFCQGNENFSPLPSKLVLSSSDRSDSPLFLPLSITYGGWIDGFLYTASIFSKNFHSFLGREVPLFFSLPFSVLYFTLNVFSLFIMALTSLKMPGERECLSAYKKLFLSSHNVASSFDHSIINYENICEPQRTTTFM